MLEALGLLEKIRDRDRERRELEKQSRSIVLFHLYPSYNPYPLLIGAQLVHFVTQTVLVISN